jgi:hypothetical protein
MVTVVASGDLRILEVRIEPSLLAGGDREMIQDLTVAAVNAALASAQRLVQEELQRHPQTLRLGCAGFLESARSPPRGSPSSCSEPRNPCPRSSVTRSSGSRRRSCSAPSAST